MLFYEKLQSLLREFFEEEEYTELNKLYRKHRDHVEDWEKELYAVFPMVEKHAYAITLHFGTAEEFMEYIQQVCRPVRDTYLYCCRKEA